MHDTLSGEDMLERFDLATAALLGQGGEAQVYALDSERVVRLYHGSVDPTFVAQRRTLYDFLRSQDPPFALPQILDSGTYRGRTYTVEPRMPGSDFRKVLPALTGRERERALLSYVTVAEQIGTIRLPNLPFGEVLSVHHPIRRTKWSTFVWDKIQANLQHGRPDLEQDVPQLDERLAAIQQMVRLVEGVQEPYVVHGDYFPGNVFIDDDGTICGVGDFGGTTLAGDPRMDLAGALVFLEVVDGYHPDDTALLHDHLVAQYGLSILEIIQLYRMYYAIYFSHCKRDDPATYAWCVTSLRMLAVEHGGRG